MECCIVEVRKIIYGISLVILTIPENLFSDDDIDIEDNQKIKQYIESQLSSALEKLERQKLEGLSFQLPAFSHEWQARASLWEPPDLYNFGLIVKDDPLSLSPTVSPLPSQDGLSFLSGIDSQTKSPDDNGGNSNNNNDDNFKKLKDSSPSPSRDTREKSQEPGDNASAKSDPNDIFSKPPTGASKAAITEDSFDLSAPPKAYKLSDVLPFSQLLTAPTSQDQERSKAKTLASSLSGKSKEEILKEEKKELKHDIRKQFKRAIEGWYAGVGSLYSNSRANTTNMMVSYEGETWSATTMDLYTSLGDSSGISSATVGSQSRTKTSPLVRRDGDFFLNSSNITVARPATGDDVLHYYQASGNVDKDFVVGRSCKAGLSFVTGFGEFIHGDVYAGLDLSLDFSKRHTHVDTVPTTRHSYTATMNQRGFVPSVSLRIGMFSDMFDAMFFGKLGFSYIDVKTNIDSFGKVH